MSRRSSWELLQPYRSPFIGLPVTGSNFYYYIESIKWFVPFVRRLVGVLHCEWLANTYRQGKLALLLRIQPLLRPEIRRLAATLWRTLT